MDYYWSTILGIPFVVIFDKLPHLINTSYFHSLALLFASQTSSKKLYIYIFGLANKIFFALWKSMKSFFFFFDITFLFAIQFFFFCHTNFYILEFKDFYIHFNQIKWFLGKYPWRGDFFRFQGDQFLPFPLISIKQKFYMPFGAQPHPTSATHILAPNKKP